MPLQSNEYKEIQRRANSLLTKYQIKECPIPVFDIAKKMSLEVIEYNIGDSASGILIVENGKGKIGYNPNEPKVRQRFTVAHELGHFLMHKENHDSVFVDKNFLVKYRNYKNYTPKEYQHELQANAFAAALLMPEKFVHEEFSKNIYDELSEPAAIHKLANFFEVSDIAMTYRLTELNINLSR